jgi:phosphomannomutase
MSSLIMSMSGMRAITGDSLDPHLCLDMAMAYGTFIGKGPVILGGDTRVTYDIVEKAVISGLLAVGTDVINVGRVLTPTVQQMIGHYNAKGGLVISASHNPIQWNGIKVMNGNGSFLTPDEFQRYMDIFNKKEFTLQTWDTIGQETKVSDAIEQHINRLLDKIDVSDIQAANLNVLSDPNNGAGALANALLFERCGVQFDILNHEAHGRFAHNPEPLKENLTELMDCLAKGDYDIGFAQDADADRLVILDEKGRFIGEDYSLAFCVDYVLGQQEDAHPKVVVNLSTSLVVEAVAKTHGAETFYTVIGETNVTQGLRQRKAVVGGEGNGGVIYPKVGWGRDSLVGMVLALKYLAKTKRTVSEIVSTYPAFVMIRDKYTIATRAEVLPFLEKIKAHFSSEKQDHQDGVKIIFNNKWLHVRPSNTEPIVRIFVEAPTLEEAQALIDIAKSL